LPQAVNPLILTVILKIRICPMGEKYEVNLPFKYHVHIQFFKKKKMAE